MLVVKRNTCTLCKTELKKMPWENAIIVKQNVIYLIILKRKYTFFPTMQLIDCSLINYNNMNQRK